MGVFENIHDHDTAREFADDLTQAGRMNHGHAGPMFIAKLIEHVKEVGGDDGEFDIRVADGVSGFVAGLGLGPEADPAVVRLASVFGLVAVTGCLASEFGVFPLMANEITAGVAKCFRDLIAVRGGSKNKVTASALVMIRDHIQTNRGRFLSYEKTNGAGGASVHRTPDLKAPHNHAGFIEYDTAERATGTVYVFPKVMKDEVLSKAPRSNLLKELVDRELLFKQDVADRFTIKKRVPGYGPGNYYAIDLTVMELNDDGSDPVAVVAKKVSKPRLSVIS